MASVAQVIVEIQGKDQASGPIGAVQKALAGLGGAVSAPIGAVSKLTAALGGIGLAAQGIQAITGAAMGLGSALGVGLATQAENTRATFAAFIKDGTQLNATLAMVRAEADKTPFTFAAMSQAVAGLVPSANAAKIPLIELTHTAEILAASHPEQGLQGAAFALREAVSGDFQSIIDRFDLPRSTLNKLKAEGVPAAQAVQIAMKEMGYDMDLVGNLAKTTEGRLSTFQDAIDGIRLKVAQPLLAALGEQLDAMSGWLATNSEAVGAFAQNLGDFLAEGVRVGAKAIGQLVEFLKPIGPIVATLAASALAAIHGDWANAMNGLQTAAAAAIDFLDTKFGPAGQILASLATAALAAVQGDWSGAMTQLQAAGQRALDWLSGPLTGAISAVQSAFSDFAPTGEIIGRLFDTIASAVAAVLPHLTGAAQKIAAAGEASDGAHGAIEGIATVVNAVATAAEKSIEWLTQSKSGIVVLGAASGVAAALVGGWALGMVAAGVSAAGAAIGLGIMTAAQWALNVAMTANPIGIVVVGIAALIGILVAAYASNETFRNGVNAAWTMIVQHVIPAVAAVMATIKGLSDWVQSQGGTFQGAATAIGVAIWQGMVAGISSGLTWVKNAAMNLATAAVEAAKAILRPGSPSKEFTELFESVGEGAAQGVENTTDDLIGAVESMLASARDTAETAAVSAFENLGSILGAQFEKAYTLVEAAQMASLQKQEDAEGQYQRAQDKEQRAFDRKLADLQEEAGRATLKERQGVNERIAQLQEDHGRRLIDMAEAQEEKLIDIQLDGMDAVAKAQERTNLIRGEAMRDIQRGVEDLERESAAKSTAIAKKAAEATQEAIKQGADDTQAELDKAAQKIQDALDAQTLNRTIRGRKADFSTGQDAESLKFKTDRDDADLLVKQQEQLADRRLRVQESEADVGRKRSREDADAEYNLAQDLEDAKDDVARAALLVKFQRTKQDRDRTRQLDDDERDRKASADAAALTASFAKATADLAKRRAADVVAADFKKKQQADAQKFNDGLEDEALKRQADRTNADAQTRIAAITKAMDEKLAKIKKTEQEEQEALKVSYTQKVADLKEKFLDKVGPLTETAMGALNDFLSGVTARLGAVVEAASRAASAVATIGQGKGTASAAAGARAGDGQTFGGQSADVQQMFISTFGSRAAAEEAWIAQHNYEIDAGNLGKIKPTYDANGVQMTGPYNGEGGNPGGFWSVSEEGGSNASDHMALGGPVTRGRRYMVGERGPEEFVPSMNGTIVPNGGGGGGNDRPVVIHNHLYIDGREIGVVTRTQDRRFAAANVGANGVGGNLP